MADRGGPSKVYPKGKARTSFGKVKGGRVKPVGGGPSKAYPKGTGVKGTGRMARTFTSPTPRTRQSFFK